MKGFTRTVTLWDGTNLTVAATGVTPKGMANLLTLDVAPPLTP